MSDEWQIKERRSSIIAWFDGVISYTRVTRKLVTNKLHRRAVSTIPWVNVITPVITESIHRLNGGNPER